TLTWAGAIRWTAGICGVALAAALSVLTAEGAAAQDRAGLSERATSGLDLPVREVQLDNGMRFLLLPRPGAPTVAFVVEYRVGGVDEVPGRTGIAHLLEHLLFKGSTSIGTRDVEAERPWFERMDAVHDSVLAERGRLRPDTARIRVFEGRIATLEDSARTLLVPNEFDRILSRNGARGLNATTAAEATTYFVELPSNRTELWFALESDRMRSPVFREFYTERDVVMEERRLRIDTSPGGKLYEAHLAAAFTIHPYGQPVAGTMSDLESLTRRDVEDYYRRFYGPRNATVAIVGDLDPDLLERWAHRWFGDIPPGEIPPPVLTREPPQAGTRRVEVLFDAQPSLRMGWHVPGLVHEDTPALAILGSLLTGGRSARLQRRLVQEDRIATFVSAGRGPGDRYPHLFTVDATPRAPHGPAEIEAAVLDELARLARTPPDSAEVARVRIQIESGRVRRLASNLGLAFQLAESASALGDWRETFRLSDRLVEVTPEDIQRVVRRYLHAANLTVATLVPADSADASAPRR
ncbi:MAG: insulinase family protein, partial [Gemmatimonadetes bacterium]|nr:insulinase family protein [Gemmatimonadota bacterium]